MSKKTLTLGGGGENMPFLEIKVLPLKRKKRSK